MVESVIHGICICPDPFPLLTSLSFPGEVETRISPPARSFVSHEISTQPCPKGRGFGFALMFPVTLLVRSVLVISLKEQAFGCYGNLRLCALWRLLETSQMFVAKQNLQLFARCVRRVEFARFSDPVFRELLPKFFRFVEFN